MNSFEKYIKEHRAELDMEQANPASWLALENKILRQKNRRNVRLIKWISSAAAVAIALILALNYLYTPTKNPMNMLALYGLDSKAYVMEVENKTQALTTAQIPLDRKQDFDKLLKQLAFLDDQYHDYLQYV